VRFLVFLLLAFVVVFFAHRAIRRLGPAQRKSALRVLVGGALLGLLGIVVFRLGVQWLAIAGAGAFAVLRRLAPLLLKLLPMLANRRAGRDRFAGGAGQTARAKTMTRAEALEVLGLGERASREEISQAYKALIRKVHPDSPGGSTFLAKQVNEAKKVLLG
jgi:hypothetical protein